MRKNSVQNQGTFFILRREASTCISIFGMQMKLPLYSRSSSGAKDELNMSRTNISSFPCFLQFMEPYHCIRFVLTCLVTLCGLGLKCHHKDDKSVKVCLLLEATFFIKSCLIANLKTCWWYAQHMTFFFGFFSFYFTMYFMLGSLVFIAKSNLIVVTRVFIVYFLEGVLKICNYSWVCTLYCNYNGFY